MQEVAAVEISVLPPFDGDGLLAFLAHRAIPGVEHIEGRTYARTVLLPSGPGTLRLELPSSVTATSVSARFRLSSSSDRSPAELLCVRLLDATADPDQIAHVLGADPVLAPAVAARPGTRLPGAVDGPEIVLRALLGQQVSVAAARTTLARLAARAGSSLPEPDGPLTHLFPPPAAIAALGVDGIPGPRRRAMAINAAATDMASGSLLVDPGRTTAELTADLVARPGIGPWTAGYVAMRVLGDRDVLLTGDLVLRQGAAALGLPSTEKALATRGAVWSPFRSYAGLHLWRMASS